MDNPPTPQHVMRSTEKQKSTTNTLLNLLTRRSTKVEPSPSYQDNINSTLNPSNNTDTNTGATSVHSSPISTLNQFRQGHLRRHSSTQNLSSIRRDESASPLHKRTIGGIPKKAKSSTTNRFSHQFTLCCSVHDERMCTPPVSVRYNSMAQVELCRTLNKKPSDEILNAPNENNGFGITTKAETTNKVPNGHVSLVPTTNSFTTATVHSNNLESLQVPSADTTNPFNLLPMAQALSTDESSNDDSTDKPVVFNEYQSSIAMSACRSRLRERLLPPSGHFVRSLDLPNSPPITTEQHFSSPNICTIASNGSSPARDKSTAISASVVTNRNRSLSYDVLTGVRRPASADSLAKQSLIAAQLLNLIPAEKARERFVRF